MSAADEAYDRLHGPDGFTQLAGAVARVTPCSCSAQRARAEAAELRLNLVRGLLAAYGEAEGTPVDYEFLVHHIKEAIQ